MAVRLLERESALASLVECAEQARAGQGRLVLVAGEAGVGKSTLVERLRTELPDACWWWGACDGSFTPRPLGPLFDLADQLGGDLADLCAAGASREQLFRALLHRIGSPETLDVVVIEDVHWADDATLDLLRYLARRLRDAPVLLVVTYRDHGVAAEDPLRVALGDLASQQCTRRVGLTPLSPEAVDVLAAGSGLGGADLHQLTGGNPFYLTEILNNRTEVLNNRAEEPSNRDGHVPTSVRDVVLARAGRLGERARGVLEVAALVGVRVELSLLESVTGGPASTLDELVTSGLLGEDGDALRFRHEITRLALATAVPAHRARGIHGQILAQLHLLGCADDARLAFHAEAAGDADAVLRHVPAAARQATRLGSHRQAAAQFERALRFAAGMDPAAQADLYQALADELSLLDRWPEAQAAAQHALTLWRRTGDRLREGATLRRLAVIERNLCQGRQAVATALAAVDVLESLGPGIELARAYATLANQRMLHADHDTAVGLARRAQELAAPLGATDVESDALNTEAVARAANGLEWAAHMHRALDLALAAGHHDQAARAYHNLCSIHLDHRQFGEVERYVADGLAYCDEHDLTTYAAGLRAAQANLLERTGQWDQATALNLRLLTQAGPSPANRLCALIRLGAMRARRGEPDAWTYLDEAATIADATGEPQQQIAARLARAEAHWLAGRLDQARHETELAHDLSAHTDAWCRGAVAAWLQRTGSTRPPSAQIAEPYQLLLQDQPARAAAVWTRLGCPYDAATTLAETSDQQALYTALGTLTSLGASPAARIVRRRLRTLGARSIPTGPRSATRTHPYRLTPRQREVLDLIRAKYTNAEIAGKLSISQKTVGHHVTAILAKLDVATRAAAAHRADLLDTERQAAEAGS